MNPAASLAWGGAPIPVGKPNGLAVQPLRFASHFPAWPCGLGLGLFSAMLIMLAQPAWWPLAGLLLGVNVLFWTRVWRRFRQGNMRPATVVSTAPLTLAVGDRCAAVAVYNGYGHAEYWEDFTPMLIECVTDSRLAIERVVRTIPAEEWAHLEEGLKHLPETLRLGQYPLRFLS